MLALHFSIVEPGVRTVTPHTISTEWLSHFGLLLHNRHIVHSVILGALDGIGKPGAVVPCIPGGKKPLFKNIFGPNYSRDEVVPRLL